MPPYPSPTVFADLLTQEPLHVLVENYLFAGVPFVFRDHPSTHSILTDHLSNALEVPSQDLAVVGSAKIGFSLGPDTFPRPFSNTSDIDVVVVNYRLFDSAWLAMLRWHYPRRFSGLAGVDAPWAADRRKEIYWGWLTPDRVRFTGLSFPRVLAPVRSLSTLWFNAFQGLSQYPELADRVVSGRLYRTWNHALLYHTDGLRQIRSLIASGAVRVRI